MRVDAATNQYAGYAPLSSSRAAPGIRARAGAIAAEARQAMASEEAQSASGGAGAATENRAESPKRPVEGEYIDRVSRRRRESNVDAVSPFARQFAAVQQMGGAEFMARGGRLDLFA